VTQPHQTPFQHSIRVQPHALDALHQTEHRLPVLRRVDAGWRHHQSAPPVRAPHNTHRPRAPAAAHPRSAASASTAPTPAPRSAATARAPTAAAAAAAAEPAGPPPDRSRPPVAEASLTPRRQTVKDGGTSKQ
jgi:hypothetical protein